MHGDNWKIYQDKAMNGDGASTEGYDSKADCFDNARRNGMPVDLLIEQVI